MRVSGTDWAEGGSDIEQTIAFAQALAARGCSGIMCRVVACCATGPPLVSESLFVDLSMGLASRKQGRDRDVKGDVSYERTCRGSVALQCKQSQ
jgi:hypothetical protein